MRIFTDKEGMAQSWTRDKVARSGFTYGPKLKKKMHRSPLATDVQMRKSAPKALNTPDRQGPRIKYIGKNAVEETTPIAANRFDPAGPLFKQKSSVLSLARRGVRPDVRPYSGY